MATDMPSRFPVTRFLNPKDNIMGNVQTIEETSYDCWVLYSKEEDKEYGDFVFYDFVSYDEAKEYLLDNPYLIDRGFLPAHKRITYDVHSLD